MIDAVILDRENTKIEHVLRYLAKKWRQRLSN